MTAAYGRADQKGAVIGTLRSLGALARAFGPLVSSFGKYLRHFRPIMFANKYSEIIINIFFLVFFVFGAGPCYCIGAVGLIIPFVLLRQSPL